jgi:hypothetical protein
MGCTTTKEALQPVEDSSTTTSNDPQQNQTKTVNKAAKAVPGIGEYISCLFKRSRLRHIIDISRYAIWRN